jgi:hypothetical protein
MAIEVMTMLVVPVLYSAVQERRVLRTLRLARPAAGAAGTA